jgi:formylmethanofuran dehydrogenase subunit B
MEPGAVEYDSASKAMCVEFREWSVYQVMTVADAAETMTTADVPCLGCGCLCDDIELSVRSNEVVAAKHACAIGEAWFQNSAQETGPECLINGKPASFDAAVAAAAAILRASASPLLYGLTELATESQRLALALADKIGACVDTSAAARNAPFLLALQEVGEVTCTLGEIKNRGDLILLWGCNPVVTHPRHFERYSLQARGRFLTDGRAGRHCVTIHSSSTETDAFADQIIKTRPGSDFASFWTLRALAKGALVDAAQVEQSTGVPLSGWQTLIDRIKAARYGSLLFEHSLFAGAEGRAVAHAMLGLVRDLNAHARFVCAPLGGPGNGAGAENVVTWTTGYPFAVSLARGYPRFGPGEYSAEAVLSKGEADAALIVGAGDLASELSPTAQSALARIPSIVIDHRQSRLAGATVAFLTSTPGVHSGGTVYRADHVPLPLRPTMNSPLPDATDVLRALLAETGSLVDTSTALAGTTA